MHQKTIKFAHVLLICTIVTLVSCKCEYHLNKAIEGGCLKLDTIIYHDTLKGFQVDTVFHSDTTILRAVDTFILDKGGVTVKTIVRWQERKITETVTKKDTVFTRIHVPFKQLVPVEKLPWWVIPAFIVIALGWILTLASRIIKHFKEK